MSVVDDELLFELPPRLADVTERMHKYQLLRDQLVDELGDVDRELRRLDALAHALPELADEPRAAVVAGRLAERSWPGTGDQLVVTARVVLAQAGRS
ncbi:UNVERIFIED_ORG: hypothetical protein E4P37_12590 [Bacillus sp. AZ43]